MLAAALAGCGSDAPSTPQARPAPLVSAQELEHKQEPPPAAIAHAPDVPVEAAPPATDSGDTGSGGSEGGDTNTGTGASEPSDPFHDEVDPGDSLSRILSRVGLDSQEILALSTAMTPWMDPATIRVGQRYDIEIDAHEDLVSFVLQRTATETVRVIRAEDGSFSAELEEIETEVREEQIGGTIDSSLWRALTKRGHSAALVDVIVDTFAYDIDFFTATRKGDRFRIIVQRHEVAGELVRYGRVLAAEYLGASDSYVVLLWRPGGKGEGRYVNDKGEGVTRTLLKTPLKYARISSGFDPKRMHPVLHREKSHNGVDYAAPEGTPVWAAAGGRLVHRKAAGGAGNMVILSHEGGLKTLYMHLSKFADGQHVGQKIKAKTVIGYVGSTGLATGPHLHFGVKKNGRYVDPTKVKSTRGSGVPRAQRKQFAKHLADWRARLDAIDVR